jgi:hypothetical protein
MAEAQKSLISLSTFWGKVQEYFKILANGNVGIGTNNPTANLDVVGSLVKLPNNVVLGVGEQGNQVQFGSPNGETGMSISGSSGRGDLRFGPNTFGDATLKLVARPPGSGPPSEASGIAVSTTGRVGIGTVYPSGKLAIEELSAGRCAGIIVTFGNPAFGINCQTALLVRTGSSSDSLILATGPTGNAFHVRGDGNVDIKGSLAIGTFAPFRTLEVNGRARISSIPLEASSATVCFNGAGDLLQCGGSSLRWKTNVHTFLGGLDIIRRLRPINFNWKESGLPDIGLGAEEVAKVAPSLTFVNNKGEAEGVKYERLNIVLINAVKEQQAQLQQQQKLIEQQGRQVEQLQTQLNQVKRTIRSKRSAKR